MPALTLKFEMAEVDPVSREPLRGVLHEVEVDASELHVHDLNRSLRENLPDLDREARNAVAARKVDYDSFKGDSDYLNAVERLAANYYTLCVSLEGAAAKRYVAEGIYPEDGGLWSDEVSGINASEAEFQAAWAMAEGADGPMEKRIYPDVTPEASLESQLLSMEDQRIVTVDAARPSREDAFNALDRLCAAARETGLEHEALVNAEALLKANKDADFASMNDGIDYIEPEEPAAQPSR